MFAGLINDEVQENIIWPELPYVTDEHGSMSNILEYNVPILKASLDCFPYYFIDYVILLCCRYLFSNEEY